MRSIGIGILLAGLVAILAPAAAQAQAGHITGIGGVFVTSKDPKALAAWYRDVLGIAVEPWGGAMLRYDAPEHPPVAVWTVLRETSPQIAPSPRGFMLDFAVDDLDAIVARLEAKGVKILKRTSDETGKFAWILDPDGTKIELWQPLSR
ncbi:VOC family protein [Sphingomonas trueperi]|uniref:VOC family protein n=1 Tax=Sphingomonas trueperi TaxID=53317 RepID=UPI000EAE2535